jgi:hypothetical protein
MYDGLPFPARQLAGTAEVRHGRCFFYARCRLLGRLTPWPVSGFLSTIPYLCIVSVRLMCLLCMYVCEGVKKGREGVCVVCVGE